MGALVLTFVMSGSITNSYGITDTVTQTVEEKTLHENGCQALEQAAQGSGRVGIPGGVKKTHR